MPIWSQVTVRGTIVAEDDKSPIPGVTIVEKGTENGTISKIDGTFIIGVTEPNSILIFSTVGMRTQEFPLKGRKDILVIGKWDCNKDFFDSQQILLYANSGIINDPLGIQIELASPWFLGGVIKGLFSYQTNLKENEFYNGQIELSHYISNCDFDMDFMWSIRQVAFDKDISSTANSIETALNLRNIKLVLGYSHLNFSRIETIDNESLPGIIFGVGTSFNMPLRPTVLGKLSVYNSRLEYQAFVQGGYKRFSCFVKYYKLNSFNELSIGLGIGFGYWLKGQKK
jgi:hypothetical protein